MPQIAPRISPRLLDVIERLAARREPIAAINRRVDLESERLGLPRPSYQRVRELVHEARELHHQPTPGAVLLDIATRSRSPWALEELATLPRRERLRDGRPK